MSGVCALNRLTMSALPTYMKLKVKIVKLKVEKFHLYKGYGQRIDKMLILKPPIDLDITKG